MQKQNSVLSGQSRVLVATVFVGAVLCVTTSPNALAAFQEGTTRGLQLVRDLEVTPAHATFGGDIWELSSSNGLATVALANAALWRIEGDGVAPTLLLREVDRREIHQLELGSLAARGTHPGTGVEGLWLVDGDGAQLLAPPRLRPPTPWRRPTIARFRDTVLAKTTQDSETGDSLWRLSANAGPESLGPSGAKRTDWNSPFLCGSVASTPKGFLHCRWQGYGIGSRLWLHDGTSEVPVLPSLAIFDMLESRRFGDHNYVVVQPWSEAEWPGRLIRTDGTIAGTEVFDAIDPDNGLIELEDRLGWLQTSEEGHWQLRATDGSSPAVTLAQGATPQWPLIGRSADGWLYLHAWTSAGGYSLWAVSLIDGEIHEVELEGRRAGGFTEVASLGATVAFLSEPDGGDRCTSLWRFDPLGGSERLTAPACGWPPRGGARLVPRGGDPLIPLIGPEGRWRMNRFDSRGSLQLWDGLFLGGSAGSSPLVLGELHGEAILFAITAAEGATFWRSSGTAATTRPIAPAITSACDRTSDQRPILVPPDLLVDCIDTDGRATAWRLDSLDQFHQLEVHATWPSSPFARIAGFVIHAGPDGLIATSVFDGAANTLLDGCEQPALRRLSDLVVVACSAGTRRGEVWSTAGTAESSVLLLDFSSASSLTSAGGVGIVSSAEGSWLTDGSVRGTRAIDGPIFAVDGPPEATWTCGLGSDGTIVRLDLPTGNQTLIGSSEHGFSLAGPWPPGSPIVPLIEYVSGVLWRCDGTESGTRPLGAAAPGYTWEARSRTVTGTTLWTYRVTEDLKEELLAIDLETGEIVAVRDHALPLNDDVRSLSPISRPFPLTVAASHLWASLSDEAHGREPWALRLEATALFADGFESGDTSAWSQGSQR